MKWLMGWGKDVPNGITKNDRIWGSWLQDWRIFWDPWSVPSGHRVDPHLFYRQKHPHAS